MAGQEKISHDEIWDDSTFVDSWNDALEEYKHYHSIHARGEKVQDVLKSHDQKTNGLSKEIDYEQNQVYEELVKDSHVKSTSAESVDFVAGNKHKNMDKDNDQSQASDNGDSKAPVVPQHLIGQVHDENLKNLLMSWYYAGYYTGLHEGQSRAETKQ
ncbi:hypothetical protein B7494_g244 [Chlorociboria aeruginascens]|nr:hypothetical protein B7494_g244 [Chlorociboria aeruginascens]